MLEDVSRRLAQVNRALGSKVLRAAIGPTTTKRPQSMQRLPIGLVS
jgi:hypothetical protein